MRLCLLGIQVFLPRVLFRPLWAYPALSTRLVFMICPDCAARSNAWLILIASTADRCVLVSVRCRSLAVILFILIIRPIPSMHGMLWPVGLCPQGFPL